MPTATLSKWGNSQGFLVPKDICESLHLRIGDKLHMRVDQGSIVVEPQHDYTLEGRMRDWDGVRYQSIETDWGSPVGHEMW